MVNKKEKKTALRKEKHKLTNSLFAHSHFWQYKEKRNGFYIYECMDCSCNAQLWYKPCDHYGRKE